MCIHVTCMITHLATIRTDSSDFLVKCILDVVAAFSAADFLSGAKLMLSGKLLLCSVCYF